MTERIDLDDVEVESEAEADGTEGDWLWGDEDAEDIEGDLGGGGSSTGSTDRSADSDAEESAAQSPGDSQGNRVPHVPREGSDSPAGIPKDRGGSGAGAGDDGAGTATEGEAPRTDDSTTETTEAGTEKRASGPHGGGVDEMATAYTYEAVQRLEDPRIALAETNEWSDWVGLVGDVPAHAINAFLREHQLDIDFFNGSGDGPAERLAAIGEHSMFYSERMVVVGTEGEEWIADEADWEFVALRDAAEKADWAFED